MNKKRYFEILNEELELSDQEQFESPSVWFGVGLGIGVAVKAMERTLAEEQVETEKNDPNVIAEIDGSKLYGQ